MTNNGAMPLISIALRTYNGAAYLRPQIDSLLRQDYPRFEIVVVDDASNDDTPAILAEYAKEDRRITVHYNATNLGFQRNSEKALRLCHGDLIAPCDQDDIWHPEKLSKLMGVIGEAPMVYCDSELVDAHGRPTGKRRSDKIAFSTIKDPAAVLFNSCVAGHAMLFRRELLDKALPLPSIPAHDMWLTCAATCQGQVVYWPECLVQWRQHSANASNFLKSRRTPKSRRPRGYKLTNRKLIGLRIEYCANHVQGREAAFFKTLHKLWRTWFSHPISLSLTVFLIYHRHRLFATLHNRKFRHARRALQFFWGLPIKRLLQPYGYENRTPS